MRPLSKSKIIAFRQCAKRMWLEIHRPDLKEDSASTKASYDVGNQVGAIARRIYDPEACGALIDAESEGYDAAFARTTKLLACASGPIFEAALRIEGALAFADVMVPDNTSSRAGWKIVEVKSSTSVKEYHVDDVSVQTFIAQTAGVQMTTVAVACIDSSWTYPGGGDYRGLLAETDLTDVALGRTAEVATWLARAQEVATSSTEPDIKTGDHCHEPFECGFCNYCNRALRKADYPLDWLPGLRADKKQRLADQGIVDLRAVPDDLLNDKQRLVKRQTLANTVYFDACGAEADLAVYGLPAYFLDFETIQFAVPIWPGTRPYQKIPFQFSLHVLDENGALTHQAFLDISGGDPSLSFARMLVARCGGVGPIYTYNATFEKSRIAELGGRYPELAPALESLSERIVDLLPVARNRYYHPSQKGSWSIKCVLPAAVPELSYDALSGVKDGNMAMEAFAEAIDPETSKERRLEIEQHLLAYCRLDTFAMVRLWQFFRGRAGPPLEDPPSR